MVLIDFFSNRTRILSVSTIVCAIGILIGLMSLNWSPWILGAPLVLLIFTLSSVVLDIY